MKIHHLNCGSFCPLSHPIVNRALPQLDRFNLVCHCLLIETESGLVLVDTGLGLEDVRNHQRFKSNLVFNQFAKPKLDLEETAYIQITKMGFSPKDVKHIIVTHFDSDHIGGLADFPEATIHLLQDEWDAAQNPSSPREKARYQKIRWEQNRNIETYKVGGDEWHGFKRVQNLRGVAPSIFLVSLPGHTRGHAGIYIENQNPLFHAGDAFMLSPQLKGDKEILPLTLYNKLAHEDLKQAAQTLDKLKQFQTSSPGCDLFCSHDRGMLLNSLKKEKGGR